MRASEHQTPEGVSEETIEGVGKLSEAFEYIERAKGHLYSFHQLMGRADFLVGYFGEDVTRLCGNCDNCRSGTAEEPVTEHAAFALQSRVRHDEFGPGIVTDLEEDRLTVLFEDVGYRTLSLEVVEQQGLLEPDGS